MCYDVHQETDTYSESRRIPGANFDEVTYADDTICMSTDTNTMNKFFEAIDWDGFGYGLKLNRKQVNYLIHTKMQTYISKMRAK